MLQFLVLLKIQKRIYPDNIVINLMKIQLSLNKVSSSDIHQDNLLNLHRYYCF